MKKHTEEELYILKENIEILKQSNEAQRKHLAKMMLKYGRMILDQEYYELAEVKGNVK